LKTVGEHTQHWLCMETGHEQVFRLAENVHLWWVTQLRILRPSCR